MPVTKKQSKKGEMKMCEEKIEELQKLSKPLMQFLQTNTNPHTQLIIDFERIRISEDVVNIPIFRQNKHIL